MEMDADRYFRLLRDPTRLQVLSLLSHEGELRVPRFNARRHCSLHVTGLKGMVQISLTDKPGRWWIPAALSTAEL